MNKIDYVSNESLHSTNTAFNKMSVLLICSLNNYDNYKANQALKIIVLFLVFFFTLTAIYAQPIKAFPTANGAGAYATGGRGKPVYIVTNLNNSGAGSFRQALENTRVSNGGIITFSVSGTILLTSKLEFTNQNNITIAGQTAPAGGITIVSANSTAKIVFQLMNNFIIRYIRFRPDYPAFPSTELDAINIFDSNNYIIDHCSISWGTDENADSGDGINYTWQRNLFAESNRSGMILGEEVENSENMSFINNMFYNCSKRFPNTQSNGRVDIINNVIWNFRTLISANQGGHDLNHIGNYYQFFSDIQIADEGRWNLWEPLNSTTAGTTLIKYPSIYTSGNYISDVLTNPNADNYFTWRWRNDPVGSPYIGAAPSSQLTTDFKANTQFPLLGSSFTIQSAVDAFDNVRHNVGANARLDENGNSIEELDGPDTIYLNNVQNDIRVNFTPESSLSTVHFNAFQASVSTTPINMHPSNFDANNDGIPNQWVINKGFGVNDNLRTYVWPSGYVGIEEYLNEVDNSTSPNLTTGCSGEITSYPYSEGFENTLGAWTQSSADNINWTVGTNGTPSNGTGPSSASQGTYYAFVEASGTGYPTKQAILNSPCFNLSGLSEANFSFKYHQYGSVDMGSIDLEASDDDGVSWTSIWNSVGNKGDTWLIANVDLGTYVGGSVQLRFNRVTGGTFEADIALDEINLSVINATVIVDDCSTEIMSYPYSEGFENTLGAWTQSSSDDINWTIDNNGTPSNGTGPSNAAQGTYYVYVEASGTGYPTKQAILNSPCFNLSGLSEANFNFKYHQYGSTDMGNIDLEASDDNGANWTSIWNSAGNKGNTWLTANVDISAYVGGNVQLRFNRITGGTWEADIAIDEVNLFVENTVVDMEAPVITLIGASTINLNTGHAYNELGATATDNVDGNISANISIGGVTVNTNAIGTYMVSYNVSDAAGNDAIQVIRTVNVSSSSSGCTVGITSFPYSEGFENTLGTWTQSSLDDNNWTVDAYGTPSSGTGPSNASQGTYYVYVEASNYLNKQAILNSPCFDLSGLSNATFSFKYHQFGSANMGSIDLEASDDNGASWTSIWNSTGNLGDTWLSADVDISSYVGASIQLRFNRATGSTWQADIAIDDVSLSESGNTGGNGCFRGITSYPYSEGFENTLGTWTQSLADDFDWTVDASGTPSKETGPTSANQGTYYVYVEASNYLNKQAILNSPCFDLNTQTSATFSFNFHQYGAPDMGTIDLEASDDDGVSWVSIWTSSGNLGDSWQSANINLTAYTGGSVQLRFKRITGSTWQADFAIDNVNLSTGMVRMQTTTTAFDDVKEIIIYPNPVKEAILNIKSTYTNMSYEIYNMVGQLVSKGNVKNNAIDISNLNGAIYQITFSSEGEIITKQFIKQ